jgi:Zn-dependent protease
MYRLAGLAGGTMQATIAQPKSKPKVNSSTGSAALLLLAVKGKTLLLSLLKLKYLYSALTAVISIFAYAWRFGWAGATGFVALLFVHEMGHVLMLRSQGVPASVPMFIPFVGAIISMKQYPKSVVEEAYSAIAGPVLGSVGALVCLAIYFVTGSQLFAWLAYIGFFLNLFNLLPMSPLDGGRVIGAVWRGFWVLGIVASVILATMWGSALLFLISVFGLSEINKRYIAVHWAAYALLGTVGLVASTINGEVFLGVIIAYLCWTHGKKASADRQLATAPTGGTRSFRISGPKWCPLSSRYSHRAAMARGRDLHKSLSMVEDSGKSPYFMVPKKQRIIIGTMYVGLACTLTGILVWMHSAGLFTRPHG